MMFSNGRVSSSRADLSSGLPGRKKPFVGGKGRGQMIRKWLNKERVWETPQPQKFESLVYSGYSSMADVPNELSTDPRHHVKFPSVICVIGLRLRGVGYAFGEIKDKLDGDYFTKSIQVLTGGTTSNVITLENLPKDGKVDLMAGKNPKKDLIIYGSDGLSVNRVADKFTDVKPYDGFTRQGIESTPVRTLSWKNFMENPNGIFQSFSISESISHDSAESVQDYIMEPSDFAFKGSFPDEEKVGFERPWGQHSGHSADSSNASKTLFWVDVLGKKEKNLSKKIDELYDESGVNDDLDPSVWMANEMVNKESKDPKIHSVLKKLQQPIDYHHEFETKRKFGFSGESRVGPASKVSSWSGGASDSNPSIISSPMEQRRHLKESIRNTKDIQFDDSKHFVRRHKSRSPKHRMYNRIKRSTGRFGRNV